MDYFFYYYSFSEMLSDFIIQSIDSFKECFCCSTISLKLCTVCLYGFCCNLIILHFDIFIAKMLEKIFEENNIYHKRLTYF